MGLVPEWAPNVHPLIVHFPIALVIVAALADALALVMRQRPYRVAAAALYAAAGVGALAAFLTGNAAEESVMLAGEAVGAVNAHAQWAVWTVWALGLYGLARLGAALWDRHNRLALHAALAVLGLGAVFLVWQTAERGARLVFEYGVGVGTTEVGAQGTGGEEAAEPVSGESFRLTAFGGWRWDAGPAASLPAAFDVIEGGADDLQVVSEDDSTIALHVARGPVMLVAGEPLEGAQLDAELDLSDFAGSVALVHHVRSPEAYDYLALGRGEAVQGRIADGGDTVFDRSAVTVAGPVRLRVVGLGKHFRGYLDGRMVTHGHDAAAPAGTAGLRLDGTGTVYLRRLETSLLTE